MQNAIRSEIKRVADRVFARKQARLNTEEDYRVRFEKRTGFDAGMPPDNGLGPVNRHFDPKYCKRNANFLAKTIWHKVIAGEYKPQPALNFFVDKADGTKRSLMPATIAALDSFAAAPFPLRFDRIENRKAVTLRTREPLAEARAFQKALVNHLLREKAPIMDGTTPEPHITINYRGDRLGSQTLGALKLPPIGWTVDEIILTESIVGKTTHVEHGRWPLCGDAG